MSIIFLNGDFIQASEAKISILDSGYYFGDGIYEVILLFKGKMIDEKEHFDRLETTAKEVKFKNIPTKETIIHAINEVIKRNPNIQTGSIYIQLTRGIGPRTHKIKDLNRTPSLMVSLHQVNIDLESAMKVHWHCMLQAEQRRFRRDIKMISLMPMILSKLEAEEKGFDDVIYYDRESKAVTEGSSFNLFVVTKDNTILTHPIGPELLAGCTRKAAISILRNAGYSVKEERFFEKELLDAKEVFATGAIKLFIPITKIEDRTINTGDVGEITKFVFEKYCQLILGC